MPSNVLVSNAGNSVVNGIYNYMGETAGKPFYHYIDSENLYKLFWTGSLATQRWQIWRVPSTILYRSPDQVDFPWLITSWNIGTIPYPIITEIPVSTEPTFGLPADIIALITSRFGTVANYLRLRNQGQI